MRANFIDILELLKLAKSLGPIVASKEGANSAYKNLTQSRLFASHNLNELSQTEAAELVSKTGIQEIDIGSPEFLGFYAAEPTAQQFGTKSLFNKNQPLPLLCKLSEIGQHSNLNYVQAVKNNEFAFHVLKIQGRFYKAQPEDLIELSILLLPDSIREMLKQFGMTDDTLRKMLASKLKGTY